MNSPFLITPFEFKNYKEDDNNYIVEGIASKYGNVDLGDDVVVKGAFSEDLIAKGSIRPILWQHQSAQPVGTGEFYEGQDGLYVKISMPKSDTFVSGRVMPQIKAGAVKGLSIGYGVKSCDYERRDGKTIRMLKNLKLSETSIVTFAMNEEAVILAAKQYLLDHNIKSLEDGKMIDFEEKTVVGYKDYPIGADVAWDKNRAVQQIREKTGSKEKPSTSYKNGFLWYDAENEDKFTSYKLPYVYVEGGRMVANPRALSAIVGAIAGARGGLNIPEEDKNQIKAQLNRYFAKMEREKPFKSDGKTLIDHTTIQYLEQRDYEKLFDDDIIISNAARKYVADMLGGEDESPDIEETEIEAAKKLLNILKGEKI